MNRARVTRLRQFIAGGALALMAVPAAAQTPAASRPGDDDAAGAPYSRWSLGVLSGGQQVRQRGVTVGGELSVRLRKFIHVTVEGGWMSDVATASRYQEIQGFADYIRGAYGVAVTGDITGPTVFGMAGLKFIPDGKPSGESAGIRPYATLTAGMARVEFKPAYVIDGQATTGAGLIVYNVAIGSDLMGTTNRFAYGGGAGVIFGETWYLDLGARILRIQTTDHPTTVKRLVIGMGRRF